ncbi:MAG: sugar nucleotide-binding protein [bacterium]
MQTAAYPEKSDHGDHTVHPEKASHPEKANHPESATHRNEYKIQRLIPISSAEYPTAAKRPACSLLSSEALLRDFGLCLPDWEISLNQVLDQG